MELIKKTRKVPAKTGKKSIQQFGLFLCPYCKKEIERQVSSGIQNKSCGCYRGKLISISNKKLKTIHGFKGSRIYNIWATMIGRCCCKSSGAYSSYGAKGITVCNEWKKSFICFKNWAFKNGYKDNLQIDRKKNNKGYYPSNCRWVTCAANNQNRTNNIFNWEIINSIRKDYDTGDYLQKKLAKKYNTSKQNINDIVNNKTWKI